MMRFLNWSFERLRFLHIVHASQLFAILTGVTISATPLAVCMTAKAATASNSQSALGTNLAPVGINSSEQPFLNIFKTTGVSKSNPTGWITHSNAQWDTGEEAFLQLDANGYPTSLKAANEPTAQQFTSVGVIILRNLPSTSNGVYASGQYVVLYDGQGTLSYNFDASLVSSISGRDVINVANPTSGGGIFIAITSTDPNHTGNYIRNIRVVKAEQEAALNAGQIFNPIFLNLIKNFRALRFMDWFQTNGSTLSSWSNRPLLTDAGWGSTSGVPVEAAIQVANAISADAWFNIPAMADNNYITQFATLAHQQLGATQQAYVEYSNETWNYSFSQAAWIQAQGQAEWPTNNEIYYLNRNWFGQRTAQICDIWKSIWGSDANRVVCVMAAQAANPSTATEALDCALWTAGAPCSNHGITAVAIAPYFGGQVPSAWTAQSDGGLAYLFSEITQGGLIPNDSGGFLALASSWERAYAAALATYKLPMIAYEGGQGFASFPNGVNADGSNNALTNLLIAANRDARMGVAYTTYFNQWKSNGGQLFMHFNDIAGYSQYGEWGALESFMQTTSPLASAPPKWQAMQNFITGNACWWAACAGSLVSSASVPMAPTNLTVH